jgi:hypothetical protein
MKLPNKDVYTDCALFMGCVVTLAAGAVCVLRLIVSVGGVK